MKKTINIFTLMELLIVIAMIAILASLLLPALNSAQKKAMGIQCSNQLKQHLTALISYTSDYDDWSFCAGMGLPGVNTTGFQWYGMVNFIQNVRHSNGSFHNNTRIGIFRCPLDTSRTSTGGIYQNYGYNGRHEAYHTDQSSSNPWRGMDFRKIGKNQASIPSDVDRRRQTDQLWGQCCKLHQCPGNQSGNYESLSTERHYASWRNFRKLWHGGRSCFDSDLFKSRGRIPSWRRFFFL